MRAFPCHCGNTLFFRNPGCARCGRQVNFLPDQQRLSAVEPAADGTLVPVSPGAAVRPYRQCQNQLQHQVCNWLIPAAEPAAMCVACRLNRTIPDLSVADNLELWRRLEVAKHHTVYSLLRLGLPIPDKQSYPDDGLAFEFLADSTADSEFTEPLYDTPPVVTGHNKGVVTINLAEADPVARTRIRRNLGEGYRTLLGHFRHEVGHYYWQHLIAGSNDLQAFRDSFGDERADYGKALQAYYAQRPPRQAPPQYISAYASAHPWEDWAECWAHYLHMTDTLETACDYGLHIHDRLEEHRPGEETPVRIDCPGEDFDAMLEDWRRLSVAINSLNRSMGLEDAYPFVITGVVRDKLAFVHAVIGRARSGGNAGGQSPESPSGPRG